MTRKALLVACLSAAVLVGCAGRESAGPSAGGGAVPMELVALAHPPIPDLPVPVGFTLDESRCRSFEASGARYVDHVYRGRGDKLAVKRFYERHMPANRWRMVTDMFVRGTVKLDFEKQTEKCRVEIVETGWFSRVEIRVAVWTSGAPLTDRTR